MVLASDTEWFLSLSFFLNDFLYLVLPCASVLTLVSASLVLSYGFFSWLQFALANWGRHFNQPNAVSPIKSIIPAQSRQKQARNQSKPGRVGLPPGGVTWEKGKSTQWKLDLARSLVLWMGSEWRDHREEKKSQNWDTQGYPWILPGNDSLCYKRDKAEKETTNSVWDPTSWGRETWQFYVSAAVTWTIEPRNSTSGYTLPQKLKSGTQTDISRPVFIAGLFTSAKRWKQSSIQQQMNG